MHQCRIAGIVRCQPVVAAADVDIIVYTYINNMKKEKEKYLIVPVSDGTSEC